MLASELEDGGPTFLISVRVTSTTIMRPNWQARSQHRGRSDRQLASDRADCWHR